MSPPPFFVSSNSTFADFKLKKTSQRLHEFGEPIENKQLKQRLFLLKKTLIVRVISPCFSKKCRFHLCLSPSQVLRSLTFEGPTEPRGKAAIKLTFFRKYFSDYIFFSLLAHFHPKSGQNLLFPLFKFILNC